MTETQVAERRIPRGAVGTLVDARVRRLTATLALATTRAMLARLRANIAREPGVDPTIWSETIEGVPGTPFGDAATREEWAVHTALTLFALHQQGKSDSMRRDGVGLGHAVRRLDGEGRTDGGVSATRRRFDTVVTASSLAELRHHLRGLIGQLRAKGIGLDYGAFADDLLAFQHPGGADVVRRRWARQFHHHDRRTSTQASDKAAEPTESGDTE